jgi:hypothetical protein
MSFIVKPGRNAIVAAAFAGLQQDERRMKRIASMTKAKPAPEPELTPAPKKKARRK